ncbi:MBL fold metallo-hydrolase [Thiomicrorhabdus cannonii]|uniref:MBL fold metallo-hydrolase n=1 Tax=Thiomicrorhabdus cannonii TaxID=2748011 RepID=UPI0015BF8D22|nr:MBL fold metallo-hydrolase [Thiomicrorhabdus cannonii]
MNTLKITIALALCCGFFPLGGVASDAYTEGFERYADEMKKFENYGLMQASAATYAKEMQQVLRKQGYIGKRLPIPQAVEVTDGVYTVVGSLIWHNPANFGLNNNLSFMVFEDGVFVFNAGANPALAYTLHQQIKQVTDKPVKWVAVENSQGHAYLGAGYWVDQGVKHLYSHSLANRDFHKGFDAIKASWGSRVGHELTESARDVSPLFTTFDDTMTVEVGGGETVQLMNFGPGHTPGSTVVYVPQRKVVLPGDLAYNERMLALFAYTDTRKWVESFERFMDAIPHDVTVIPGHGAPTTMQQVKQDTYDYLKDMHQQIGKLIAAGGTERTLEQIDQSAYADRPVYEQTYRNNALHIYLEFTGGDLGVSNE